MTPWAFNPNAPITRTPLQQREEAERELRAYLATLPVEERRQYLAGRRAVLRGDQPQEQDRPQAQPPEQPRQEERPAAPVHIHIPRGDDRSDLERMGDDIEDAMRDENYSRVSQSREQKRMDHARNIESMRLEALTRRLGDYQQPSPGPSPMSGMFRVWNPETQQWEDGGSALRFGP